MASPIQTQILVSVLLGLAFQTVSVSATEQAVLNAPPTTAAPVVSFDSTEKLLELGLEGYEYHGCWTDTTGWTSTAAVRSIGPGRFTTDDSMTLSKCLNHCSEQSGHSANPFRYAALLEGQTCHCSSSISPYFARLEDETSTLRCSTPCAGNSDEACGGQGAFSVYRVSGEEDDEDCYEDEQEEGESERFVRKVEKFTTTTMTFTTTKSLDELEIESTQDQQGGQKLSEDELQTGIAWSQYAGPSTWYGILAAITFVIAAVV